MNDFIANYYQPWLIASGVTFIIVIAFVLWAAFSTKDEIKDDLKKDRETTNVTPQQILRGTVIVAIGSAIGSSLLCLIIGLFFAVPEYNRVQNIPTATPDPLVGERFLMSNLIEIQIASDGVKFIEPESAPEIMGNYILSPQNDQIVYIDPPGTIVNLNTGAIRKLNSTVNRRSVFSPDGKYLATGIQDNIVIEELATGKVIEPITPKCRQYGLGTVSISNLCLFVGDPIWLDADSFAFPHEQGLLDDNYIFPDETQITLGPEKNVIGEWNAVSVADLNGTITPRPDLFANIQPTPHNYLDHYWLDPSALTKGGIIYRHVSIATDDLAKAESYLTREESQFIPSPDQALILYAPNLIIDVKSGGVTELFEKSPFDHHYDSCVWNPTGDHIACIYRSGSLSNNTAYFYLKIISVATLHSREFILDTPNLARLMLWRK